MCSVYGSPHKDRNSRVCVRFSRVSLLFVQTSDLWNKRHSVAIGDVHECKLIRRKEISVKQVDHIWKSMTAAQYVRVTCTDSGGDVDCCSGLLTPLLLCQFAESAGAGLAGWGPQPGPRQRQTHRPQRVQGEQVGHRGSGKQSRCELAPLFCRPPVSVVANVSSVCRGHAILGGLGHEMSGQL